MLLHGYLTVVNMFTLQPSALENNIRISQQMVQLQVGVWSVAATFNFSIKVGYMNYFYTLCL